MALNGGMSGGAAKAHLSVTAAAALLLCGCATGDGWTPLPRPGDPIDLPGLAIRVSAQLQETAGDDPERLAAVELELRRVADALSPPSPDALARAAALAPSRAQPQTAAASTDEPSASPAGAASESAATAQESAATPAQAASGPYPPAPPLSSARSLFPALTLGTYPNADTARAAWFGMNAAHGDALAGLDARVESVTRETGAPAFILKAGPFASAQEAESLCGRLRQAGAVCAAGDFTGAPL